MTAGPPAGARAGRQRREGRETSVASLLRARRSQRRPVLRGPRDVHRGPLQEHARDAGGAHAPGDVRPVIGRGGSDILQCVESATVVRTGTRTAGDES